MTNQTLVLGRYVGNQYVYIYIYTFIDKGLRVFLETRAVGFGRLGFGRSFF